MYYIYIKYISIYKYIYKYSHVLYFLDRSEWENGFMAVHVNIMCKGYRHHEVPNDI